MYFALVLYNCDNVEEVRNGDFKIKMEKFLTRKCRSIELNDFLNN